MRRHWEADGKEAASSFLLAFFHPYNYKYKPYKCTLSYLFFVLVAIFNWTQNIQMLSFSLQWFELSEIMSLQDPYDVLTSVMAAKTTD
jgi:hypothetical protein